MIATAALGFILATALRQARRTRRALAAFVAAEENCTASWCSCRIWDER